MTNFADLHLSTPRLHLRPIGPADAQALYGIFSDPVVMRYWSTPPWASIEFAHEWIARDMQTMAAGEHLRLGIVERAGGALLGSCSLFHLAPTCRRAEVGYGLAQAAWGKGYVQEAVGALLRHGFAAMDLNRVEADIDPRNTASARSLARLGFRREGLLRERWIVAGEVSDSALYGLLRADWQARQG